MNVDIFPQEDAEPIQIFDRNCVLIMDGNRDSLQRIASWFEQQQFEVIAHTAGDYGLAAARKMHPDCVIVNQDLLDIDGLTVCQTLVDDAETCGIPVILIGQDRSHSLVSRARKAGAEFFLAQPVDPRTLILLANEAIAQSRSWICE